MRKKMLSIALSVCLVLTMMPAMAFAGESADSEQKVKQHVRVDNTIGHTDAVMADAEMELQEEGTAMKHKASATPPKVVQNVEDPSAEVNGVKYDSIYTAIENAPAGATVKVLQSLLLYDTIVIDKRLTLDLGGNYLVSTQAEDVITVYDTKATIKNGYIHNYYVPQEYVATCIFATGSADVNITDINLHTVRMDSDGVYVNSGSKVTMSNCEYTNSLEGIYTSYVEDITTVQDYNVGVYVREGGQLTMSKCYFDVYSCSYCVWAEGAVELNDCYLVQMYSKHTNSDYYGVAVLARDSSEIIINDGYYYGENPVWIAHSTATVTVKEGWFRTYWNGDPVFNGNGLSCTSKLIIPSGYRASEKNWAELGNVDELWVYRNAAPGRVTADLTGYDDIKITWSKVSGVDGYSVYYKKSGGSYSLLKTVSATGTRSASKSNLTDGAKYYAKVVPYVMVAEEVLADGGKKVSCSTYKTDYVYTLKKLAKPTLSRSDGKVKVKWKNISGETGYQISKSTKKSGTYIVSTYKTTSGTYKKIKATKGKTYYYKVRAYKVVDGKKIYGPWSDVKSFKR